MLAAEGPAAVPDPGAYREILLVERLAETTPAQGLGAAAQAAQPACIEFGIGEPGAFARREITGRRDRIGPSAFEHADGNASTGEIRRDRQSTRTGPDDANVERFVGRNIDPFT
ncbi:MULTISPECIES: hypothetical protein [Ensifer]|uniref:Uncharacterized protein n=1 Tax=Ensifer canadensis TaxID=555315 RepID=A0AAW4FKM8_9HYPH|nr:MULTISPECIES: hypothetical protein [Ensifer]MBM3091651.1 hypothetical protein [Ensifer canadensis]MDP9630137.1 hypothetical protein [Ensifer adhaerens]UBI74363.1 hypothetical protein J3R84_12755 [Ensifer canadensis]